MRAIITGADVGTTIDFRDFGVYEAQHPWPVETTVSAGRGIVFVRKPKPGEPTSYLSMFMEVYAPGAAFIRGEGETPEDCENAAWATYQLALYCSGPGGVHAWEPRGYSNGAGFCVHCNTFKSDVFTGEGLGQHCEICQVGTTYDWEKNDAGDVVFRCKEHHVRSEKMKGLLGMLESENE
jgi:hypothetical protein